MLLIGQIRLFEHPSNFQRFAMSISKTRRVPERQSSTASLTNLQIIPRKKVYRLIAQGHLIVIANGRVLQLDKWVSRHPGGEKTILHMVGRDATDEVNGYYVSFAG